MSPNDPVDLKKKLRAEGFEIYRTLPGEIQLAERVRDNLIMDSGVAVEFATEASAMTVMVTVRAQASHFPGTSNAQLSAEAEKLAEAFSSAGYERKSVEVHPVPDPSDPQKSLDTSHEIRMSRSVSDLPALFVELRTALGRVRHSSDD